MHVSSLIIIVHKWTRNINACKLIGASGKIIDWVSLFARFFLLIKAVGFLLLLSHLNLFFLLLHCSHSTKDNIKPVWCVFFLLMPNDSSSLFLMLIELKELHCFAVVSPVFFYVVSIIMSCWLENLFLEVDDSSKISFCSVL